MTNASVFTYNPRPRRGIGNAGCPINEYFMISSGSHDSHAYSSATNREWDSIDFDRLIVIVIFRFRNIFGTGK